MLPSRSEKTQASHSFAFFGAGLGLLTLSFLSAWWTAQMANAPHTLAPHNSSHVHHHFNNNNTTFFEHDSTADKYYEISGWGSTTVTYAAGAAGVSALAKAGYDGLKYAATGAKSLITTYCGTMFGSSQTNQSSESLLENLQPGSPKNRV